MVPTEETMHKNVLTNSLVKGAVMLFFNKNGISEDITVTTNIGK